MEAGRDAMPPEPAPPPIITSRDWSELPLDALSFVFTKLDIFDILMGAGLVCHSWLDAAKAPSLWRSVDMASHKFVEEKLKSDETDVLCAMAKVAVDRSGGQLQEFSGKRFVTSELLKYIGNRAPSLKTLRLVNFYPGRQGFAEAIMKFPLLEELDLRHATRLGNRMVSYETIGKACPHLKTFRQINEPSMIDDLNSTSVSTEALGIAAMTGLRTLQLQRSRINNAGLIAILDGCPLLESLDVRNCLCLKMDDGMKARLASLKSLWLPSDLTDDCKQEVIKIKFCFVFTRKRKKPVVTDKHVFKNSICLAGLRGLSAPFTSYPYIQYEDCSD